MPEQKEDGLEQVLASVWRQALVEDTAGVEVRGEYYPVKRTSRTHLRQVDFRLDGQEFRGLEQNPNTSSRWAQLARRGKKVMQFLRGGRYVAVIADGHMTTYSDLRKTS